MVNNNMGVQFIVPASNNIKKIRPGTSASNQRRNIFKRFESSETPSGNLDHTDGGGEETDEQIMELRQ
jgi:hypothetical protein